MKREEWQRIEAKLNTTQFWTTHESGDPVTNIAVRNVKVVAGSLSPFCQKVFICPPVEMNHSFTD